VIAVDAAAWKLTTPLYLRIARLDYEPPLVGDGYYSCTSSSRGS
jgi:hypothetical protein